MASDSPAVGTMYCSSCGAEISTEAELCPECGVRQKGRQKQQSSGATEPSSRAMASLAGGVVSFFLGWIPLLGPLSGGFVAGYLRGDDTKEGAIVGFLANLLASIPGALFVGLFLVLGGLGAVVDGSGEAALGLVVWLVIFGAIFVSFYGFGALGGVIGSKVTDRSAPESDDADSASDAKANDTGTASQADSDVASATSEDGSNDETALD